MPQYLYCSVNLININNRFHRAFKLSFSGEEAYYKCGRCRALIKGSELRYFGKRVRCPYCGPEVMGKSDSPIHEKEHEIIYKVAINYRVIKAV